MPATCRGAVAGAVTGFVVDAIDSDGVKLHGCRPTRSANGRTTDVQFQFSADDLTIIIRKLVNSNRLVSSSGRKLTLNLGTAYIEVLLVGTKLLHEMKQWSRVNEATFVF